VIVFGIDPGSERTGYGCVTSDGRRHHLVQCGAIDAGSAPTLAERLQIIFRGLTERLQQCRPDCVAVENVFVSSNARSSLKLGHARGVAMLAAVECGLPVFEYTPAEVKRSTVGYGRAEKAQMQQMVTLLLGLDAVPRPHDAADALAVAICHLHQQGGRPPVLPDAAADRRSRPSSSPTSWRDYRPTSR